jgi:N-acetylglucosamine kinase-like BadF-type ATPase
MESNEIHHTGEGGHSGASRFTELQALVAKMAPDFEKFYRDGNKAAGTRVRNAMQELKTFAQMIRTEVQSIKNGNAGGAAADGDKEESD